MLLLWGTGAVASVTAPTSVECLETYSATESAPAPIPRLEDLLAQVRERASARHPGLLALDIREPHPGGRDKEIVVTVRGRDGRRREVGSLDCVLEDGVMKLNYIGVDLDFRDLGINQLLMTFLAERYPRVEAFSASLENTNAAAFVVGVSGGGNLKALTKRYQREPEYLNEVNRRFVAAFTAVRNGQSGVGLRDKILAAYEGTPAGRAYHGAGIRRLRSLCVDISGNRSYSINLSNVHTDRGEAGGEVPRVYLSDSSGEGTTKYYELRADGVLVLLAYPPH